MGSSNSRRYHWILKLLVVTWKSEACEQNCEWLFYSFSFEKNYDVWKSKHPCFLLNKNVNFNKNETEPKMENPTRSFRDKNLVLQLVWESRIKSKSVMSWSSQKKKECIFRNVYFVRKIFFKHLFYLNIYRTEWTFRIYILSHIKKQYLIHFCYLVLKLPKVFGASLRMLTGKKHRQIKLRRL